MDKKNMLHINETSQNISNGDLREIHKKFCLT